MGSRLWFAVTALFFVGALGLNNGLGRTPQMGWNSWNKFHCDINETLIVETIDAMVSSGLRDLGYVYVNLDDCWQVSRDSSNRIVADPVKFPSGIHYLSKYAHSKGLKLGIYSDAGNFTCQKRPGSLGYEEIDARTYAEWEIDYLKYDNCFDNNLPPKVRFPPMRDALNKTGRPIFYSMCEWGVDDPATWARDVSNSWRTTVDIINLFADVYMNAVLNDRWWQYAGPGGWNDPDMLEIGNGRLTAEQEKTHFALWCLIKAPLILGHDVRKVNNEIVKDKDHIAINQDSLGVQGRRIQKSLMVDVWGGELAPRGKNYAALLVNKDLLLKHTVTFNFTNLGIDPSAKMQVYDLWKKTTLGVFQGSFTTSLEKSASLSIKLSKQ